MENENEISDDVIYTLLKPFEYAFKGEIREAKFVTLRAPTVNNISSVAKLKQGFMQAITKDKNTKNYKDKKSIDDKDGDLDSLTGEMIMTVLAISDVDYSKYLEMAISVFTGSKICLIDGENEFSKNLSLKLSFDDLEGLTGEYLRVFILSSVLRMMQA